MSKSKKSITFKCTDSGNAELFAELYKDKVKYDHNKQRWLVWRKHWWVEDNCGEVMRMAKRAARVRLGKAVKLPEGEFRDDEIQWAVRSESRYQLEAVISLARFEPNISDPGTNWDSDPWLLGVQNGVVDLRTGRLRKGLPSDRITMHTGVAFRPSAKADQWETFVKDVFVEDDVIDFIHRAVGYSITGLTTEQCFFACFGEGANGKSTFLETIRYVLGDYACNTPFSTLELAGRSSIPIDLAELVGRRFVTANETNDNVRLNEARLKSLTGSDSLTARRLYKEQFTFTPVAKFWLAFNHKPSVRDDSHGFWRRTRLVPFKQTFQGEKQKKDLPAILGAEAQGILAWTVRGCLKWQAEGLGLPTSIKAATEEYRDESDPLRDFIDEWCIIEPAKRVTTSDLWLCYLNWVKANGEPQPLGRASLTRRLEARGLRKTREGHDRTWTWRGICLRPGHRISLVS